MKLFIAIDVNQDFRRGLTELQSQAQHYLSADYGIKRKVSPDDFHLTLRYIGKTDDVSGIVDRMSALQFQPFHLKLSHTGIFHDEQFPVAWAGVDGDLNPLSALKSQVDTLLDDFPCAKSIHSFVPHITLLFLNQSPCSDALPLPVPTSEMTVSKITLYEIRSGHCTSKFQKIQSFPACGIGGHV